MHPDPPELILDQLHWTLFTLRSLNNAAGMRNGWLRQLLPQLDPNERQRTALVGDIFGPALAEAQPWPDMARYLAHLDAEAPASVQARIVRRLAQASASDAERLLAEPAAFMRAIKALNPAWALNMAVGQEALRVLRAPAALHALLSEHLRHMWAQYLAPEWERAAPALTSVLAITPVGDLASTVAVLCPQASAAVAALQLRGLVRIVPVLQLLPQPQTLEADGVTWLALAPQVQTERGAAAAPLVRTRPIGRNELLARLRALADPTRLDILALVQAQGDIAAQEIIGMLELPQSSTSRHLNALASSGFLRERRAGGASKAYQPVPGQIEATMAAVQQWLDGNLPVEEPLPPLETPLQRYLNAAGSLVVWPSSQHERMIVLEHLAREFVPGRRYSEADVNAMLRRHPAMDVAYLRRALISYRLVQRESDGSAYWRAVQAG